MSNLQAQSNVRPSAPPIPSSGPVRYPDIYQPKESEKSKEEQANKDFWNMNLDDKDKEKAGNANFWGDAMGGSKLAPKAQPSPRNEREAEINRQISIEIFLFASPFSNRPSLILSGFLGWFNSSKQLPKKTVDHYCLVKYCPYAA